MHRSFTSPAREASTHRCPREARLNAFRNVGRIIGICFVQNELCPITLNRLVIKYIRGLPIGWHDLAFFDLDLCESLRQLISDAETSGGERSLPSSTFASPLTWAERREARSDRAAFQWPPSAGDARQCAELRAAVCDAPDAVQCRLN